MMFNGNQELAVEYFLQKRVLAWWASYLQIKNYMGDGYPNTDNLSFPTASSVPI